MCLVMKRQSRAVIIILTCAVAIFAHAQASSVAGDYAGTLGELHLRLHVRQGHSGSLTGTLDSVDQGDFGIQCSQFSIAGKQLSFAVPEVHGTYKGEISEDGNTITGTWDQGTPTPLIFKGRVPPTVASLSSKLAQIDSTTAAAFDKNPVGSVTIGIVSGTQLIWTKSYGNADMQKHLAANKDTVYRIGSITKMFTALMLEQLADAGKVHFSDPVEKYLPEVNKVGGRYPGASPITLIELATHTSGLAQEPDDTEKYVQGPVADWEKTLISALPKLHYEFEPGTHYSYSNIGYAILGASLARAAGDSYLDYLPKHIFQPLGMTSSALVLTPAIEAHLAAGYQMENGKIDAETPLREHAGRGYKVPNGAMYTTVGDLAKFASFLLGHGPETVLETSKLQAFQNQFEVVSSSRLNDGYGMGFSLERRDNYIALGHGGAVAGYQAAIYVNEEADIGAIVLVNAIGRGTVGSGRIASSALDLLSK